MIGVLIVGLCVLVVSGRTATMDGLTLVAAVAKPQFDAPAFSWPATFQLVIPLTITVVAIYAPRDGVLLRSAGHQPPVAAIANSCGVFSAVTTCFGRVSSCLTDQSSAVLASSGPKHPHWIADISGRPRNLVRRVLAVSCEDAVGNATGFRGDTDRIGRPAHLAWSIQTAFQKQFSLGALVAFLVTLRGLPIFGIDALFWGIVFGVAASLALERSDFATMRRQPSSVEILKASRQLLLGSRPWTITPRGSSRWRGRGASRRGQSG